MFKVGLAYVLGSGVRVDTFRAIEWYSRAIGASMATDRDMQLEDVSRQTIDMLWNGFEDKVRGVAEISDRTIDEQKELIGKQENLIADLRTTVDSRDVLLQECLDTWKLRLSDLETCSDNLDRCREGTN